MPEGVMQWFDEDRGEGRIAVKGRVYPVAVTDHVESHARVPGARVHFDIKRRDGVEYAANVEAKVGTRTSHRHLRRGDQAGAHDMAANAPSKTERFTQLGLNREQRPRQVIRELLSHWASGQLATARPLLAPDVVLHQVADNGGEPADVHGRGPVFDVLADSEVSRSGPPTTIAFDNGTATVRWCANGDDAWRAVLRADRGEVREIWWGRPMSDRKAAHELLPVGDHTPSVQIVTSGDVTATVAARGRQQLEKIVRAAPPPVLAARLKISKLRDPALKRPARVEAMIDLNGTPLRVTGSAASMSEALDIVESKLRDRLQHLRHTGGDERVTHNRLGPRRRPLRDEREWSITIAPEDREIVRHKSIADEPMTADEAMWDLEQLDFDFYLYSDLATGKDALLSTNDAGEVETHPVEHAPRLELTDAREILDTTHEPFVFFAGDDGRGRVLYRRLDGDYGLLSP